MILLQDVKNEGRRGRRDKDASLAIEESLLHGKLTADHCRPARRAASWQCGVSYGNESCRIQRDNHVVCRFTNVFVKIGVWTSNEFCMSLWKVL